MSTLAFVHATPSSKVPTLRNPSRLREVQNNDPNTELRQEKHTVAVGNEIAYELGDEITQYASALSEAGQRDVFGDAGLLAQYYMIGQRKQQEAIEFDPASAAGRMWQSECRTWDLLQRLYLERTREHDQKESLSSFASNRAAETLYYDESSVAAENKIVLDWLRDGHTMITDSKPRGNRWFYTKESVKSRKRLGKLTKSDKIITELDPDAPLRQGRRLDDQDADFERQLMRDLFNLVRSGEFNEAASVARQAGNHWRAASLQGCIEYENPIIEDSIDDGAMAEGTTNKALWRRMCFALSRQTGIDTMERALYGAMCGDLVSVLPVCTTWEDRLWAHVNAIDQANMEGYLRSNGRIDLEESTDAPEGSELSVGAVLEALKHSEQDEVRTASLDPLHVIQARLITNEIGTLLTDMHIQLSKIRDGSGASGASSPHVVRFMTHLILVLRQLGVAMPMDASNSIIQAYVDLLVSTEQSGAVALYVAQLPGDMATETLARYLSTVEDEEERREQFKAANDLDLEISATILRSVELVFDEVLSNIPAGGSVQDIGQGISQEEERCIRALEWMKLDPALRTQTVVLGNSLFRRFLLGGRLAAGCELDRRMPDSMLIPQELVLGDTAEEGPEEDLRMRNAIEYVGYCTVVRALARYDDWKTLVRQKPQETNGRRDPIGLRQWKADVSRHKGLCTLTMKEILEGNWCDPEELGLSVDDPIYEEMKQLQIMYIPEVVLRLHGVYSAQEGRDIEAALSLVVLVSDRLTDPMQRSGQLKTYVTEIGRIGSFLA